MSRSRRDESGPDRDGGRSADERERARLEREARRNGGRPPGSPSPADASAAPGVFAPRDAAPQPEHADPIPTRRQPRTSKPAPGRTSPSEPGRRAKPSGDRGALRRIQPQPPAPPAAPAGALDDETERPIGIRRVRRSARGPIVTPPGDTPAGPARRKRRSLGGRLLGLLALALLAVLLFGSYLLFQPFGSAEGDLVDITIPAGSSARQIGDRLAAAGVVDSGLLFSIRARISGKRDKLRSGKHTLRKDMTYGKAIAALSEPEVSTRPATIDVTIPEGRSRREVVPIAKRAGLRGDYLAASRRFKGALDPFSYGAPRGTRSLEGFLFPATYELKPNAPARDLVERQLAAFKENFAGIDLTRAKRKNLTGYDVLIIASMVEREAQRAKERPLIAAVIYNRLSDGIPLGIDATSRYELGKPSGALTESELDSDSPYNTRKRAGLPPTPIGNPGLSSIRAAAAPAKVKYRYFVVKPGTCGEHAFSDTNEQFQRDSDRYNAARAQAGGKSPTTC
jgi:uncharacterized YceG family protein